MIRPWGSRNYRDQSNSESSSDQRFFVPFPKRSRSRDLDRRPRRTNTTESSKTERAYGKKSKRVKRKNTLGREKEEEDQQIFQPWNGKVELTKKPRWSIFNSLEEEKKEPRKSIKKRPKEGIAYREPIDAAMPAFYYRLDPEHSMTESTNIQLVERFHLNKKSSYRIGRESSSNDIVLNQPTVSACQAVLQFRSNLSSRLFKKQGEQTKPYIMDLNSLHGTQLNGLKIEPQQFYQVKDGDVLNFGLRFSFTLVKVGPIFKRKPSVK